MKRLSIYVDTSVIGGCEDPQFSRDSLALWAGFVSGEHVLLISAHTLRELRGAPDAVRARVAEVPAEHQVLVEDDEAAGELADAYLARGVVGRGSRADALHVALASVAGADVLVSWNFKHIVNLGRIRLFQAVNIEHGWGMIEIRSPTEVLRHDD